jgi:hypothetical protein
VIVMAEKQSSRDVPATAPANDPWAEGLGVSAGRSQDGGGYGQLAVKHLQADGLVRDTQRKADDPNAKEAGGGDIFDRPGAGLSGV